MSLAHWRIWQHLSKLRYILVQISSGEKKKKKNTEKVTYCVFETILKKVVPVDFVILCNNRASAYWWSWGNLNWFGFPSWRSDFEPVPLYFFLVDESNTAFLPGERKISKQTGWGQTQWSNPESKQDFMHGVANRSGAQQTKEVTGNTSGKTAGKPHIWWFTNTRFCLICWLHGWKAGECGRSGAGQVVKAGKENKNMQVERSWGWNEREITMWVRGNINKAKECCK